MAKKLHIVYWLINKIKNYYFIGLPFLPLWLDSDTTYTNTLCGGGWFSWFPLFVWCSNILFNVHPILTAHRNFRDLILVSIPRFVSIRNNLRPFSNTPDLPEWPKWPIFLNVLSNLCQSIAISALSSTVGCIDSLLFCQSLQQCCQNNYSYLTKTYSLKVDTLMLCENLYSSPFFAMISAKLISAKNLPIYSSLSLNIKTKAWSCASSRRWVRKSSLPELLVESRDVQDTGIVICNCNQQCSVWQYNIGYVLTETKVWQNIRKIGSIT